MKMLLRGFCLPALLLVVCCAAHAQSLFFQPPGYGGSGETITADFNHDGKVDLASADGTVLLGNGDGTFTAAKPLGFSGTHIATADFNGDGKPDILLDTMVFLGNGDGTFQAPLTTITATNVSAIAVADVNGDHKADVLVLTGGGVVVFLGNGDGTFTTTHLSYGTSGQLLAVGDLNGNSKSDIILLVNSSIQILPGNGDGTFQPAIANLPIGQISAIVVKDVNGDGKLDLVAGGTGGVAVLLGNGDGTFQALISVPAPGPFAVADVDGDGKPDLISSGTFTQVFLGNGDGTFTPKSSVFGSLPSPASPSLLVADFNGDGKADLAVNNTLLFGNGDGTFQGNPVLAFQDAGVFGYTVPGGGNPLLPGAVGDFNGDGSLDVAVSSIITSNLYILLNQGNGSFVVAHTYPLGFTPESTTTADVNKDGKLDLLLTVADPNTGTLSLDVMLGNGDGTFAAPTTVLASIPSILTQTGVADFNGDHVPDLAFSAPQGLEVFLGKGDGTFGSPVVYPSSSSSAVFAAEFNGDGIVDVLMGSIFLGKGDGTFQTATALTAGCAFQSVGDVNGDGKADLVGAAPHQTQSGVQSWELDVCLSNGDGTFTALPAVGGFPKFIQFPFIADINGDGKPDLLELGGMGGGFGFLLGNGDGTFAALGGVGFTGSITPFQVQDVTGDGRPDVLLFVNNPPNDVGLITLINVSGPTIPDFAISAAPVSPESIVAGATAATTVTLAPSNGFSTAVTLSCSGLPGGANCSFTPPAVPGGSGTSTVTITTGASTPAGTYFVSIVGTSATRAHAALKTFMVTSAPPGPPDFSLAPASTATATVTAGQTATYMLSLGAAGGFSGNVALTCSGAPTTATCSVSPAMVPVGGATAATATVTVTTTARSELPLPVGHRSPREFPGRPIALMADLMAMLILAWICTKRKNQRPRWAPVLTMVLVLVHGITLTSCSGGSSGGGGGTLPSGTQAGTYTITVSATATAGSSTLSHSTKLTLVVQ
jgi:FG-GAP-like repeat/FG-GAP repeat